MEKTLLGVEGSKCKCYVTGQLFFLICLLFVASSGRKLPVLIGGTEGMVY